MPTNGDQPYNPLDQANLAESLARALERRPDIGFDDLSMFEGVGIYAIYYRGPHLLYRRLSDINQDGARMPIYVGKAVPKGARKGGRGGKVKPGPSKSRPLRGRLLKHKGSIQDTTTLAIRDFTLRYLIVDPIFVPLGESAMIGRYEPVWNVLMDGFGNNPQGSGRNLQMRSVWDEVHPGRKAAEVLPPNPVNPDDLARRVEEHLRHMIDRLSAGYEEDPLANLSFREANEPAKATIEEDDNADDED